MRDFIGRDAEKDKQNAENKKPFEEPKLKFVEPKLIKHGDATKVTAGFFGSFSPSPD